ncbi:MAG TPA: lysozyme inhibitor LprI family protein [Aquabacterium sp.]|nr:lysozyme inhibitor LprI family protein [Aquabacterium sp.]
MIPRLTNMHHQTLLTATHCLTAVALLAVAAPGAAAAPAKPSGRVDACAGSANEAALLACRTRLHDQSMAAQQQLIDRLRKRLESDEPEQLKLLLAAQAAFAQYRDAECRLRTFESRNGSAFQAYWLSCLTERNRQRIADLQDLVDNP